MSAGRAAPAAVRQGIGVQGAGAGARGVKNFRAVS